MPHYVAEAFDSFAEVADRWAPLCRAQCSSPFQTLRWLGGFYAAFAERPGVRALPVEVRDAAGQIALALPLLLVERDGLGVVEFADLGITDYNMPILGPAAPTDAAAAEAALAALRTALPAADLLVFTKMPQLAGARPNPLLDALPAVPSSLFGNYVVPGDDYEAWLRTLDKHDRKELARFWRVFTRHPQARFLKAASLAEAEPVLAFIEATQRARIEALGHTYLLDDPDYAGFYRAMMAEGIADGTITITALMAGDEVVAGLYGVCDGRHYAMVRIAFAGGEWASASPGRLLIERSIAALHGEGYRWFDFTIGDYAHKRGFSAAHTPLFEATVALSLRGLPQVGYERAKAYVKARPQLERFARRLLGKPAAA